MELYAIRRVITGSITKNWDAIVEGATRSRELGMEIAVELGHLLEEMPDTMSPKRHMLTNCAGVFDDEQQSVLEWVSTSAHEIWIESAGIEVAIIEGGNASHRLNTVLSQLEMCCQREESLEVLLTYIDVCRGQVEFLAAFVGVLPRNPGLCFPNESEVNSRYER